MAPLSRKSSEWLQKPEDALILSHTHTCTHACLCTCTHTRTHACTHARARACMHACMHAHMHSLNHSLFPLLALSSLSLSLSLSLSPNTCITADRLVEKRRGRADLVLSAPSGVIAPKISLQPHLAALWAQAQKLVWLWQKCMGYPKSDTVAVQFWHLCFLAA